MVNFFKKRYKGEKQVSDKFLGGYVPQELFDVVLLISAFSGKTKTCVMLEALNSLIQQKYGDRGKLENEVAQRAMRTWAIVKESENKNSAEDFIKNVKYELKTLGLSDKTVGRIIQIFEDNGTN